MLFIGKERKSNLTLYRVSDTIFFLISICLIYPPIRYPKIKNSPGFLFL
jgi:hypothetical protein